MAVFTVGVRQFGYNADPRFKRWAKAVRCVSDIDLAKENGYAFTGQFVDFGYSVPLEPGQFVILAWNTGSMKRHEYSYMLASVDSEGHAVEVDLNPDWIATRITVAHLPDAVMAKVKNSYLYQLAAYCWTQLQTSHAPAPESESNLETLWKAILALKETEQVELRNRLLQAL